MYIAVATIAGFGAVLSLAGGIVDGFGFFVVHQLDVCYSSDNSYCNDSSDRSCTCLDNRRNFNDGDFYYCLEIGESVDSCGDILTTYYNSLLCSTLLLVVVALVSVIISIMSCVNCCCRNNYNSTVYVTSPVPTYAGQEMISMTAASQPSAAPSRHGVLFYTTSCCDWLQ